MRNEKEAENILSKALTGISVIIAFVVGYFITWALVFREIIPSLTKGYVIYSITISGVYAITMFLWVALMFIMISKKRRKRFIKSVEEVK